MNKNPDTYLLYEYSDKVSYDEKIPYKVSNRLVRYLPKVKLS